MREIKFRVWCMYDKKYLDDEDYLLDSGGSIVSLEDYGELGGIMKNVIIEQYTGLKDKNGVEVYDGDVLEIGNYLYDIYFEQGCFRYKQRSDYEHSDVMWGMNTKMIEVIGNIHDE